LWWSYEGANDWEICELLPVTDDNEKGGQDLVQYVLNASEVHMSLMIRDGEVGAVTTTNERVTWCISIWLGVHHIGKHSWSSRQLLR
jgi:hypothetical protein